MSDPNPPEQKSANNVKGRAVPPTRKGKGKGPLFAILLLLLMGAGAFFFFKNRQNEISGGATPNLELPKLPDLSSLNLPKPEVNAQPTPAPAPENTLSQNQPFNYPQNNNTPANNNTPPTVPAQEPIKPAEPVVVQPKEQIIVKNEAISPPKQPEQINARQSAQPTTPKPALKPIRANPKKQISSQRVKSGYSNFQARSFAGRPEAKNTSKILPAQKSLINSQAIAPKQGLIAGSLASFIAYPEESPHGLAVKPKQIITFRTQLWQKSMALNYATSRLAGLGYKKFQIPIDDYERGGSTVIEAINQNGEQAYFSFKPTYKGDTSNTAWKLELY